MIEFRRIDDLGRVAIPKILRKEMGIDEGDYLKIEYKSGDNSLKVTIESKYDK